MKKPDARSLSDEALNERLRQAVRCRLQGSGLKESAARCGLGLTSANDAWQRYQRGGWRAVEVCRSGRPQGSGMILTEAQQKQTQRLIADKMPD